MAVECASKALLGGTLKLLSKALLGEQLQHQSFTKQRLGQALGSRQPFAATMADAPSTQGASCRRTLDLAKEVRPLLFQDVLVAKQAVLVRHEAVP